MPPLTESQARFLADARVGRLATADSTGRPHVIPVCFAFDGDAIYIVLDRKPKSVALARLRRVRNILENPQASLVVDHWDEDWQALRYVLASCRAELLDGDGDGDEEDAGRLHAPGEIRSIPGDVPGGQPGHQADTAKVHRLELQRGVGGIDLSSEPNSEIQWVQFFE